MGAGIRNGVPGLELLTGGEAEAMEPMLAPGVAGALYAPTTGTVNPWQLGIAAFENAAANGMEPMLGTTVVGIRKTKFGYLVETDRSELRCRLSSTVQDFRGSDTGAVLSLRHASSDRWSRIPGPGQTGAEAKRVIFQQAQSCGKGITAIPCVEGNLLLSGVRKPVGEPFATTKEGISELKTSAVSLFPNLNMQQVIRSFAAARPNPQRDDGESIHDFSIAYPAPGFFSLIGIKTPGLTCANELGRYLTEKTAAFLDAHPNPRFTPHRQAIAKTNDPEIICLCEASARRDSGSNPKGSFHGGWGQAESGKRYGCLPGSRCSFAIEQILREVRHGAL